MDPNEEVDYSADDNLEFENVPTEAPEIVRCGGPCFKFKEQHLFSKTQWFKYQQNQRRKPKCFECIEAEKAALVSNHY